MLAAGVCHSDLHLSDGYFDLGGGKKLSLADRGMKLPLTLGHENVGEVVAVGPRGARASRSATGGWSIPGSAAANARSASAATRSSAASHAEPRRVLATAATPTHLLVPHPRYLFDIGDLPPERAAPLACSGVTTYGALKKVGPTLTTEPIVIIGAGGLGLMCLALAQGDGRPQRHRRRHRSGQARGRAKRRRRRR